MRLLSIRPAALEVQVDLVTEIKFLALGTDSRTMVIMTALQEICSGLLQSAVLQHRGPRHQKLGLKCGVVILHLLRKAIHFELKMTSGAAPFAYMLKTLPRSQHVQFAIPRITQRER